jgi:hypothetical protein
MIASRSGNHSLGSLFGGEREQFIQRAPLFESSCALLIVEFEKYLALGNCGKGFRVRARRNANGLAYPAHRRLDILDPNHSVRAVILNTWDHRRHR